jgi:hypothetical protein
MDNINTSIDLSDTSSTVSYESETYAEDILDDKPIVIEEEDNLVQYTEKQFFTRSQHEIEIETFKADFLNSMDNDIQDKPPIGGSLALTLLANFCYQR